MKTLILRKCLAISSLDVLSLKNHRLKVLDISYCVSEEGILESIVLSLPDLEELFAYNFAIFVDSLRRVLKACAFDKLQVIGAHCERGHRPWEYVGLIVGSYPDSCDCVV